MTIKRILLTGDDGYNSIGTRLLIHYLKKDFDLAVAGTQTQQSGVGGYISFPQGGTWAEGEVDGVPGIWVSGHPVDAIEVAHAYFNQRFDLVISGINWGANVSGSFITSGTMAAALRSISLGLASRAIAISWHRQENDVHARHTGTELLETYFPHPGGTADRILRKAMKEKFWGSSMLNINLPSQPATTVRFTRFFPDITAFYTYPNVLDRTAYTFRYPTEFHPQQTSDTSYDTQAILAGYISITPCQRDLLDAKVYNMLSNMSRFVL